MRDYLTHGRGKVAQSVGRTVSHHDGPRVALYSADAYTSFKLGLRARYVYAALPEISERKPSFPLIVFHIINRQLSSRGSTVLLINVVDYFTNENTVGLYEAKAGSFGTNKS